MQKPPRFLLVAGEHSGDLLGAHLCRALQKQGPCTLEGVGGHNMAQAGMKILVDSTQLAVVGAVEILKKFNTLKKTMSLLSQQLHINPPDLLILIDYPGFNLRLAEKAKKAGIKVMYYVSPQIWAWHYSRIYKIKKTVDLMAVLYPFEKILYENEQVPVRFVGHPLIDALKPTLTKAQAYRQFDLNPASPLIGLLPGSRFHELEKLLPVMLRCVTRLKRHFQTAQFILPLAPNLSKTTLKKFNLAGIKLITNNTYNAVQLCDAVIATSGTVTLEVAMLEIPQVIIYKVNALTALIGRMVTNLKQIGLCNIVAQDCLALELLQNQVKPEVICDEIIRLIEDNAYRTQIKSKLSRLKQKIHSDGASERAAQAALSLI